MMGELREGLKQDDNRLRDEVGEVMREQGRMLWEEIEKMREGNRRREEEWKKEKGKLEERVKELERKVVEREGEKGDGEMKGEKKGEGGGGLEERVKWMEGMMERKERENRRRNVVIRGLEVKEGKRREEVEKIIQKIKTEVEIEEMRKVGSGGGGEGEMVVVKLAKEEQKWEVIRKKGVYVDKENMEEKLKELEEWTEGEGGGERTIIGGDFNARTGREGGGVEEGVEEGWEEEGRRRKDREINRKGRRQLGRKGGKLVATFVDLRAAFDSVDRGVLLREMRGREVREGLVERVEEVLRETKSRVKVGGEVGEAFWTARGVRQGYPLSPLLFNILLADIEEEMGRNGKQDAQVWDRIRRAAAVMGQVWGIGKRRWGGDWGKRMWFDKLVWTVMGYGVE
ncbi:PREDICTED: golgin subfamily A member 6-like protein 22, partial [Vollenhovia emeryi]|uniref:golgin subfamily A member 6-like protein 22 n=1 Tax=Vollenhovia emeryi TaxID=411798 RepID=UPI0005F58ECC